MSRPSFIAVFLSLVVSLIADEASAERPPWKARKRRTEEGILRPGVHALKDCTRWPAEPPSPTPVEPSRFRQAVIALCEGNGSNRLLGRIADEISQVADESGLDPFLLAALVYRQSRCVPTLETPFGVGLLQIQSGMIAGNIRGETLRYAVLDNGRWAERTRPIPRGSLLKLRSSLVNLRLGAAVLGMWQDQHPAIDEAFDRSVPHRTAAAHFAWGDVVRGTGGEDRLLVARRRLIERYLGHSTARATPTALGFSVVSPLEGVPRVASSGPGDDREAGGRAHRGLDIDATVGEPVAAIADGEVSFTGFDLPGRVPPRVVPYDLLATTQRPALGPGGLFVCIRHVPRIFSCYMHLQSYGVAVRERVKAGQRIGTVGRSGMRVSGSHLHLEIHRDGDAIDPAPILGPQIVIPPHETLAHDVAVANKKQRLLKERRARRKARLAERMSASP